MKSEWFKSTKSNVNTQCVEVRYRKASASGANGDCVEMHQADDEVHVRDSKNPDGPFLVFTTDEWNAFLDGAKKNEFDL